MKITRISVYKVALRSKQLESAQRLLTDDKAIDSVIVCIETDEGLTGLGEVCTIGTSCMRGLAEGTVGVPILARLLIGQDPLLVEPHNRDWDQVFKDDLYVKTLCTWRYGIS